MKPHSLLIAVIVLAALASLPGFGSPYLINIVFFLLVSFVLAQSWDWVGGEMGYINLGHGVMFGIGAYCMGILAIEGVSPPIGLVATLAVCAISAFILSFPLFRMQGHYFAFGSLSLVPLAALLAFNLSGLTKGADGLVLPPWDAGVVSYYLALVIAIAALLATVAIGRSRFGAALRAIRNDEQAAESVGIRIFPVKMAVLVLSACFAGLAGAVHALQLGFVDPPGVFGLGVALAPIIMALFGGSGLTWGPLVGVLVLGSIQQVLLVQVSILQMTVYGIAILLIGRFMPGGLLRAGRGAHRFASRQTGPDGGAARFDESVTSAAPEDAAAAPSGPVAAPSREPGKVLLECRGLTMTFGGNVALDGIDLAVREGEILGLVGPNGSGKTTFFNCICRVYSPRSGQVRLGDKSLHGLRRDEVARLGIGRTYQIPRPFSDMTVLQNLQAAIEFRAETAASRRDPRWERADSVAAYAGLGERLHVRADLLTTQEKKLLEFARALAGRPRLLLVDEVASGLTPVELQRFIERIRQIRDDFGTTVIWVEHILGALTAAADRIVVFERGRIIADAAPDEVFQDQRVRQSYLGDFRIADAKTLEGSDA